MIDLKELLINSNYKKEIEELINISNLSLKHWQTYWTGFNSTFVCEEILKEFENLNDFNFFINRINVIWCYCSHRTNKFEKTCRI